MKNKKNKIDDLENKIKLIKTRYYDGQFKHIEVYRDEILDLFLKKKYNADRLRD